MKKNIISTLLITFLLAALPLAQEAPSQQDPSEDIQARVQEILSQSAVVQEIKARRLTSRQGATPPNFLNMVALGDSLTLGVRSGGVNEQDQIEAFPALISRQVGTFFFLPLLFGPTIELVEPGLPPVTNVIPAPDVGRVFPLIVPQNLAIGGHNVLDGLVTRPDFNSLAEIDSLEDLILGLPLNLPQLGPGRLQVSQIELAVGTQPTFTIYWLCSNDVLGAATQADPSLVTPFEVFTQAYQQSVGALLTLTSSDVIVANIPALTTIPFLQSAQEVAAIVGAPLPAIGPVLGIEDGDFVTLLGLELIEPILTGQAAGPLPPNVVLTAEEAAAMTGAITQMNAFIAGFAAQVGIPVVDINGFISEVDSNGFQAGEFTLTTGFLGGVFSLDGVHPTATAQAAVANLFIERINEFWGLSVPLVDVAAVAANDDLVLKGGETGGSALDMRTLRRYGFDAARRAVEIISPDLVDKPQEPSSPPLRPRRPGGSR
ncbi:MAG TPA: SGNH/GDSL hydrolase family protein [Acidobacteriota bacterium]|nr:SGNH/GDSL hydrolase family protein [Acidobacteriota bacterium]